MGGWVEKMRKNDIPGPPPSFIFVYLFESNLRLREEVLRLPALLDGLQELHELVASPVVERLHDLEALGRQGVGDLSLDDDGPLDDGHAVQNGVLRRGRCGEDLGIADTVRADRGPGGGGGGGWKGEGGEKKGE